MSVEGGWRGKRKEGWRGEEEKEEERGAKKGEREGRLCEGEKKCGREEGLECGGEGAGICESGAVYLVRSSVRIVQRSLWWIWRGTGCCR